MLESGWLRRAGPGIAAIGAMAVIASTAAGALPPEWDPPRCPGPARAGAGTIGAWYRIDPILVDGVWSGQRLTLGRTGIERPWQLGLAAESFASGPTGGTVLVGEDDGRSSTLTLLDLAAVCAWPVGTSDDVVRHATLAPGGGTIAEHRVDRRTRADLGIWRRPLDGGPPARLLPPIPDDVRFGPTWRTELSWADYGRMLIAESCGEVSCRYRLVEMGSGRSQTVAEPSLGDLVGIADGRLVAHGACRGLPCPLYTVDQDGGIATVLHAGAGQAVIARDDAGRDIVVHEVGADGRKVRTVRPDGRDGRLLPVLGADRLVAGPAWAGSAAEHEADWIVLAPDGRIPAAGGATAALRHLTDGLSVPLDEVSR